jgi:hypothetical protein
MIGNTDFSVLDAFSDEPCCHNGKVLATEEGALIVLPYDFDQSGIINTEYAVPHESLPIRSVRTRYFRGFCRFDSELEAAAARLNQQRTAFGRGLGEDLIRERSLRRAIDYLDGSFEIINDADEFQEEVYGVCH